MMPVKISIHSMLIIIIGFCLIGGPASYAGEQTEPRNAAAYHNRGLDNIRRGEYALAILDFTKALQLDPKNTSSYTNRGFAHFLIDSNDITIKNYTEELETDQKLEGIYYNSGITYRFIGEYDKAISD